MPLSAAALGQDARAATFQGVPAVKVSEPEDKYKLVVVPATLTGDGDIEVSLAGAPILGSSDAVRGFFGVAFGMDEGRERYEAIYLRATNGRTSDPVRKERAVQYVSMPGQTWERLREEHPTVYEKAADIGPNEWVRMRIELRGDEASVFVAGAATPNLTVKRLRVAGSTGRIALWTGSISDAYFRDLKVTPLRR